MSISGIISDPLFSDVLPQPVYSLPADPKTFEMMDILDKNLAFNKPHSDKFSNIYDDLYNGRAQLNDMYRGQILGQSDYGMIDNTYQSILVQTGIFEQHTMDQLENLPYNLPNAQQAIYIGNNIPDNPISQFCDMMNYLFDSIMGDGGSILDELKYCLKSLNAHVKNVNIEGVLSEIYCISGYLGKLAGMILRELNFLRRILDMLRSFANASTYLALGNDPCIRLLYKALGTARLTHILGPLNGTTIKNNKNIDIPRIRLPGGVTI